MLSQITFLNECFIVIYFIHRVELDQQVNIKRNQNKTKMKHYILKNV